MSSGGGGEDGRGGGISCDALEGAVCRLSGMKLGGGILLGGGGWRGGGGKTIIGGLDLSITVAPPEGVRERAITSSTMALERVDSIDSLRSEVEVRGRDKKEAADSL